jgi:hypothetical protein
MNITNPPKALIVLVAMVCITVLMAIGKIDQSAGTGILGTIVGYSVGNSIRPKNGEITPPIISKRIK